MSTYRFDRWQTWDGTLYFNIEKKVFWGWSEEKYWVISRRFGEEVVMSEDEARRLMMESVDRLVKAGHTVI